MRIVKNKIILFALILLLTAITLFPNETRNSILSNTLVDFSVEAGLGFYTGYFGEFINNQGAYIVTPVMDFYISLYIIRYFGLQVLISSASVIHPYSTPIEGTILYMGIEAFFHYNWKYVFIKLFTGAGFEHPTMLLQNYASGFIETGYQFGVKLVDWLYFTQSLKYRSGILHKVDLPLESIPLASITVSFGLLFKINRPD